MMCFIEKSGTVEIIDIELCTVSVDSRGRVNVSVDRRDASQKVHSMGHEINQCLLFRLSF